MCKFISRTVSSFQGGMYGEQHEPVPRGRQHDGDWSMFMGNGLIAAAAVFDSIAAMFSAEMDRLYQVITSQRSGSGSCCSSRPIGITREHVCGVHLRRNHW